MPKRAPMSKQSVRSAPPALEERRYVLLALGALTASCASSYVAKDSTPSAAAPPAAAVPPTPPPSVAAPPPIRPFDEAIGGAIQEVFRTAPRPQGDAATVVIDPLIDGVTGYQSKATQTIQARITAIVPRDFPSYKVTRITADSLKRQPRFLVGTFTAVNDRIKPVGERESYWFCLVMGDLASGKIVAKAVARVRLDDADATPAAISADSPVWTQDPSIQAYIANCQEAHVGDAIKPQYLDGLLTAALVSEADDAYDAGHYAEALDLYATARKSPAGDQLRVYNGLYLSLSKLQRTAQAAAAFRDLVDYGLRKQQLAVKILFRPGSVRFANDAKFSAVYDMWLAQIAAQAAATNICLQITGHTSPTGTAAFNDSLSLLRAQYVQTRLEDTQPSLSKRTVAAGVGSRENLIGTGRDDASDILDRRVELKPISSCG
jgi:outer membrane protein OmpA-like peptidoglycan-associated protein